MNPQLLSQRALSTLIKSLLISLLVCSMLWCAGRQTTVLAQTEPTVPLMQNMTKLWHWGGVISTMTPVSDTLYVGMGQDLVIFDIADPTSPKLLGQLSLDAWVYDLEIVGTHALIAADSKGLLIVDVSDKQAPRLVAERHDPYTINSIAVATPYAYVAYQGSTDTAIVNSIEILDVTHPETPIVVNSQVAGLDDFDPEELQISNGYLFVAGNKFEPGRYSSTWGVLQAFALADPTAPTPLPAYRTEPGGSEKRFYNLRLQGDNAYAVRSDSILRFTISTPAAITLNSQLNLATLNSSTLNVVGDQLYVTKQISTGGDNGGLYILDTSSPSTITVSDFLTQPVDALAVQGNYAFVGRNDDGIHVWDVTNPLAPREIGNYRILSGFDGDLVAHAPFLYATGGIWGTPILSTIDLHKPTEPTLTTVITGSDYGAFYPFIDDNWLLLSAKSPASYNFDNFQLFDIANPGVPRRIARHETTPFTSAAYAAHQLYLETLDKWLPSAQIRVFDLITPTTPVSTQIIPTAPQVVFMNFNDISVGTRYLYYAGGDSGTDPVRLHPYYLYVYDLARVQIVATVELPETIYSLYHYGDTLYGVALGAHGACPSAIYIIDVAEPAAPRIRQSYCWTTFITDLLMDDHLLYIADSSLDYYRTPNKSGLSVIDFTIPYAPLLAGYARKSSVQPQIAKMNDTVYFLGNGLSAYRYTPPQATAQFDHGGSLAADFDNVTYAFPPATFAVPVTVTHTTHFVDPWLAFPTAQFGIGHAFSLASTALDTGETVQPTAAFSLTITYPDEAVQFVDETTLALYRWVDGVWVLEKSSVVDPATNTVVASPTTTGLWMLGAVLKNRSYFPLIYNQKNK